MFLKSDKTGLVELCFDYDQIKYYVLKMPPSLVYVYG